MVFSPQAKKPKFLFTLEIQELINIPKVSGSCFVKWYIKTESPTSQQLKGHTPKNHIKDYRSHWSYSHESLLRLSVKKSKELQEKTLVMIIYVETHEHHHSKTHQKLESMEHKLPKVDKTTVLGRVEINLAEYVNYEHPTSNRYLLQESKVNCILTVKIGMELLKGDKTQYVAPSIKSSNIFKGISNVLNESSTVGHDSMNGASSANATGTGNGSTSQISSEKLHKTTIILSDPILSKLYEKTFEISWDSRPGEFNAMECIDDIFSGGDGWAKNEDGKNLIDLEMNDEETDKRVEDDEKRIREFDVRSNLKSWSVNHILP